MPPTLTATHDGTLRLLDRAGHRQTELREKEERQEERLEQREERLEERRED